MNKFPTEEEWARVQTPTGINQQRKLAGFKELEFPGDLEMFPSASMLWDIYKKDTEGIEDEPKTEIKGQETLRSQMKNVFEGVSALERENRQLKVMLAERTRKLCIIEEALLEKEKELLQFIHHSYLVQRPEDSFWGRLKYLFGREVKENNTETKE